MEIRQLRAFVTIAAELHFRRAAEILHLSQSALSKQVRSLEEELGESLFLRTRHAVRPTPAGEAFLEHAKEIVRRVEAAKEAVTQAARGRTGRLEVGFCEGMEIRTVPKVLRRFRRRYPDVDLRLHPFPSLEQAEGIRRGTLDLGFVHLPLPGEDISIVRLSQEPFYLAAPKATDWRGARKRRSRRSTRNRSSC
jgi:DNA-binding transcriptional LysR family regulator